MAGYRRTEACRRKPEARMPPLRSSRCAVAAFGTAGVSGRFGGFAGTTRKMKFGDIMFGVGDIKFGGLYLMSGGRSGVNGGVANVVGVYKTKIFFLTC